MKRLVVFCDGTWQSGDDKAVSNVHRMWQMLEDVDDQGMTQRRFYQPGVGTDPTAGALKRRFRNVAGGAFGRGLDRNILEVYRWLIQEYEPGDELWFFGFSRGAYTVRSTVGLLRNCGILRRRYAHYDKKAMKLYRARRPDRHPNAPRCREFRSNYAHEIEAVRFLGVFDTVGSLGIPSWFGLPASILNRRHRFHDVGLSGIVKNAHQALAVDERRRTFKPTIWRESKQDPFRCHVEQVWFSGVHSDVGGGYPQRSLADVALRWMVERARLGGEGLAFDEARLEAPPAPDWDGVLHDSRWLPHRIPGISQLATRARAIEKGHAQGVYEAAKTRLEERADYGPVNLQRALRDDFPVVPDVDRDRRSPAPTHKSSRRTVATRT